MGGRKESKFGQQIKGYSRAIGEGGKVGYWHAAALEAFFSSEAVSKMFLLTSWREGRLSVLCFRGFYLPKEVSLPFIQFDVRSGFSFFLWCVQKKKKKKLGVKRTPF